MDKVGIGVTLQNYTVLYDVIRVMNNLNQPTFAVV